MHGSLRASTRERPSLQPLDRLGESGAERRDRRVAKQLASARDVRVRITDIAGACRNELGVQGVAEGRSDLAQKVQDGSWLARGDVDRLTTKLGCSGGEHVGVNDVAHV